MPNLVSINAPPAQKLLVYKEPACAHSNQAAMLDFATDVAPPPWRYGARIDRLELALIRYGKKSEAPYAHLCAMLTHLSQQSFRGLKITSTSPYDINAKGYQQVCRIEAKGREVASIIYVPRRSYPNMPGAVIRMNCDLLNQLGVEDDFQQLINQLLPPPGLHAFVSKIRHIELAYDVPASLKDLVMWKEGNCKLTLYKGTLYLGTRESPKSLCCYDKAERLRRQGYAASGDILRFEWRFKSIPLSDLRKVIHGSKNPFKQLHIVSKEELALAFPPTSSSGLWNAASVGNLTPALQKLTKSALRKLKRKLLVLPAPSWYCPETMWEEMLQALEACRWLR